MEEKKLLLTSWNVNGIRAALSKNLNEFVETTNADIYCFQETKVQAGQVDYAPESYHCYWNYAEKKGYSGTAVFSKIEPLTVTYGLGIPEHDKEGRVLTLEFDSFFLVNVYTPNARRDLERLPYRCDWEECFRVYLNTLREKKGVIVCGDLNVAHQEIDLKYPDANRGNAGFTDEEREKLDLLLQSGFIDSFRYFHPGQTDAYSWWSYRAGARAKNIGWRIDYFLVSEEMKDAMVSASIRPEVLGSDHCPVVLEIKL